MLHIHDLLDDFLDDHAHRHLDNRLDPLELHSVHLPRLAPVLDRGFCVTTSTILTWGTSTGCSIV